MPLSDMHRHFGEAVKNRRVQLSITQEVLSHQAGLHRTYIADVECGSRNLSLASIGKLARALNISMSELLQHVSDHQIEPKEDFRTPSESPDYSRRRL